jgi:hypothetical protein
MTMTENQQENRESRLKEALDTGRFVRNTEAGTQLRCLLCNSRGYAWGLWYEKHLQDHDYPCPECGTSYLTERAIRTHLMKSSRHAS